MTNVATPATAEINRARVFLGCFMALVATAFGFIIRATIIDDWRVQFNLSQTQIGYIQGAGLYPFAISIILFSLVVDNIGYGISMVFAFAGHLLSLIITLTARDFSMLYAGQFLFALSNGVVEAVINPVVATMYEKEKTHYLNILHAGWPGGLVLGGLLALGLGALNLDLDTATLWRLKMSLIALPTIAYGILLFGQKFPVQERVAAGVSYLEMLQEFGTASCFITCALLTTGINQILEVFGIILPFWVAALLVLVPTVLFALVVRTFGRPMFVLLLLVMFLLATTELGTDSWIADIMGSVLQSQNAGDLVLVYTSLIMFVLRFFAGPIVHVISPLGLLAVSAALACVGLVSLSYAGAAVTMVFIAATIYGFGKTFFWPTTLGVVSEQFPKGGALTLNAIAGVGMLAVGTLGNPLIGMVQDRNIDQVLRSREPQLHARVMVEKHAMLGNYLALDETKLETLSDQERETIQALVREARQATLRQIAVLPAIMFICYVGLIIYFVNRGGYQAQVLIGHEAEDEEFVGGTEGPGEA